MTHRPTDVTSRRAERAPKPRFARGRIAGGTGSVQLTRMRWCVPSLIGLSLLLGGATAPARAVTIDDYASGTNDRFANDEAFWATGFDLSGIGLTSGGQWGTLLSNNVIISANHAHPGIGAALTFYATNDPAGARTVATVAAGQRIGTSDLWIGILEQPVSSLYTSYGLIANDIPDAATFYSSALVNQIAMVVGKSPTFSGTQDVALGLNRLDVWLDDTTVGSTTADSIASLYHYASTDVTFETLLQGGDSGAPLFFNLAGTLHLVGINWWTGTVTDNTDTTYSASGYSYVGNYDTQILALVEAAAVPEPAQWSKLAGLLAVAIALRRRTVRRIPPGRGATRAPAGVPNRCRPGNAT